jgi:hypothetical protein
VPHFFVRELSKGFSTSLDWYREESQLRLYCIYLLLVSLVISQNKNYVVMKCPRCGIYFITPNCNNGREDIHCPFGCREMKRRQKSTQRSKAYYKSQEGKKKKAAINQNRKNPTDEAPDNSSEKDDPLIDYISMMLTAIEGSPQDREEIKSIYYSFDEPADEKMRQQGLDSNSS